MAGPRSISSYDGSTIKVDDVAVYSVGTFLGGGNAGNVHEAEHLGSGMVRETPAPPRACVGAARATTPRAPHLAGVRNQSHESGQLSPDPLHRPAALPGGGEGQSCHSTPLPHLVRHANLPGSNPCSPRPFTGKGHR